MSERLPGTGASPERAEHTSNSALEAFLRQAGALATTTVEPRYLEGARYGHGHAPAVLKPSNADEVSQLLRAAAAQGVRLVCQGAHTGLVQAATPQGEPVLSTERLRQVFECDALERTLRVGAGFRLSEVNERLAPLGLQLPVDLGADPSIGGMLAHNTGGTRMMRYGDMRAQTLALQVVLPDGREVRLGRGLAKDNSALALLHLWVGSHGALGVITEATLRLHTRPRQTAVALVAPDGRHQVWPIYERWCSRLGSLLSAFEGLSAPALAAACAVRGVPPPFGVSGCDYALLVELASDLTPDMLDLRALLHQELESLFDEGAVTDAVLDDDAGLWALRHAVGEGLRAEGSVFGFDISLPRRALWAFRDEATAWLGRHFAAMRVCDFGHLGDGGQHFNLVWPMDQPPLPADEQRALRQGLYRLVAQHGGSFSAEHGLGPLVAEAYREHTPPEVQALTRAVVQAVSAGAGLGRISL